MATCHPPPFLTCSLREGPTRDALLVIGEVSQGLPILTGGGLGQQTRLDIVPAWRGAPPRSPLARPDWWGTLDEPRGPVARLAELMMDDMKPYP